MTHPPILPPDDDHDLVRFLQQNRPQPPSPAPDLETKILSAIAQLDEPSQTVRPFSRSRWYRSAWVPTAIAAGLVAGVFSYRALYPSSPSASDLRVLETFIETSWDASVNDDSEEDWSVLKSQVPGFPLVIASTLSTHSLLPSIRR
ncbi:hypothetical protein J5X98_02495 [Leptothermofonsia sichuanensis E412]|uniref:hypothetical protein n=1 Tax=Leptothermofonsia sichuanensis TaxID=2917832 RepID=UPI001CA73676|nr:hypothetical protein [Leptothermofonsia sichuanensis]QZZ21369.1 hypothetical protein J5X98_02495 [Leptothermofonsia sichuanensis E412]